MYSFKPFIQPTLVVTNPPYGRRLETTQEDPCLQLATFLKTTCNGKARVAILSPNRALPSALGKPSCKPIPLVNGGLEIFLDLFNRSNE